MHDAALVAWRGFGKLRDVDRFDAWFGRILVNGCRDRLRARRRRPIVGALPMLGNLDAGRRRGADGSGSGRRGRRSRRAGPGDRDPRSRPCRRDRAAVRERPVDRGDRHPGRDPRRARSSPGSITRCGGCGPRSSPRRRDGHDRRRPRDPPPRAFRRSSACRGRVTRLRDRLAGIPVAAAPAPERRWLRLAGAAVATVAAVAIGVADREDRPRSIAASVPVIVGGPPSTTGRAPPTLMPGDGVATPSVALCVLARSRSWSSRSWRSPSAWSGSRTASTLGGVGRSWPCVTVVLLSAVRPVDVGADARGPGEAGRPASAGSRTPTGADGLDARARRACSCRVRTGRSRSRSRVTNDGSLPVTIHGLSAWSVAGVAAAETLGPSIVALGSPEPGQTWTGALLPGPDGVAPWQPVTLWPGEVGGPQRPRRGRAVRRGAGRRGVGGASGFASIPLVAGRRGVRLRRGRPDHRGRRGDAPSPAPRPDRSGTSTSCAAGPSPCCVERIGVRQRRHGRPARP